MEGKVKFKKKDDKKNGKKEMRRIDDNRMEGNKTTLFEGEKEKKGETKVNGKVREKNEKH